MFDDPAQAMSLMKLAPMGGNKGGMGPMGMSILQAALNQRGKDQAALNAQPQVGQPMAGGAMNITPPQQPMGLLSKLLGGGGLGGLAAKFGGGGDIAPPVGPNGGLGGLY